MWNLVQLVILCLFLYLAPCHAVDAPSGIKVDNIKSTEFKVSWTPPAGAYSKIAIDASGSTITVVDAAKNATSPHTVTTTTAGVNIVGNTEYTITVYAVSSTDATDVNSATNQTTTIFSAPVLTSVTGTNSMIAVDLSWTYDNGGGAKAVSEYLIKWDGGGSTGSPTAGSGSTTATISSLSANTEYTFTITAVSATVTGDTSAPSSATTVFGAPTSFSTTGATTTSINLTWTAPAVGGGKNNVLAYTIQWTVGAGGSKEISGTDTSDTISSLSANTAYSFTLAAKSAAGTGEASTPLQAITLPNPPGRPTLTRSTTNPTTEIDVSWTAPNGGDQVVDYVVEWTPDSGSPKIAANSPTTIGPLVPGQQYTVTIKAHNSGGNSVPSPAASLRTIPGVPGTPNLYQPTDGSDKTTILYANWTVPTGVVDSYQLIVYQGDVGGTLVANQTVSTNFANITSLIPGKRYQATVRAFSAGVAGGVSGNSNFAKTNPPTPTGVTLSQPNVNQTTSLKVDWVMIPTSFVISSYIISLISTKSGAVVNKTYTASAGSTPTYIVTGLTPGESYTATVQAFSSAYDPSTQSDVASSINTQQTDPLPGSPNLYQPTDGSDKTTILYANWAVPTGVVDSYQLIVYLGSVGGTLVANQTVSTNFANITSLIPGRRYQATVRAFSAGVAGDVSGDSNYAKTNPPTPTNVQLSQPTVNQTTSLKVDWVMISTPFLVSFYKISLIPDTSGAAVTNNYTTNGASPLTYIVTGLTPGESYTATMQAVSGAYPPLSQSEAVLSSNTQRTDPPTPTNVQLSQPTGDQTTNLNVDWIMMSIPSVVSYKISLTPATSGAAIVNQTFTPSPASTTTYTVTGLTPGESYTATVQAVSSDVSSSVSTPSLPQRTDPPTPTGVTLSNPTNGQTSLKVDWVMPSLYVVSSYEISLTLATSGTAVTKTYTVIAPALTYTVTGLTPGESYTATVQAVSSSVSGSVSTPSNPQRTAVDCPSECEGCIGPCKANSFGGCNCSCIAGYFPAQFICQPVLCKEDTLVHPTLLINVTFPATQAGFKDSSVEKCSYETVNGGKPYGTRNCLLNGTSTTPLWLSSCNTGLENLANVTINSTNERVSVANDLEILTSDPVSITSDDIINSVEVIHNVLDAPTVTPEVSSSVVSTVSNLVDVPAEELAVSGEADSLLMTLDTVGEKVELDENGVYEDVTSNVGMAALLPSNKKGRSGLGVESLSINSEPGFRSDQVYLIQGEIPNNVQSFITLPEEAVFGDSGNAKRIIFYAFPNDKLFLSPNNTYYDVNSMVVLSATVEQTSVNNLQEPVIIQLVTNTALNKTLSETSLCVFWNMTENLWSTSGSTVYETDQIKTICHFNHLTNFATLLARGDSAEIVSSKALDIVSIVGSSISSFCLFATILCFLCVPKLRSGGKLRGAVLLINLSLALLLLNLLLIFSEQKFVYLSSNSCLAVGVLLHFALLASFGWMMVEAANLYLVIVKPIFNRSRVTNQDVFILSNIWGWFVPGLFVGVTCGVDLSIYQRSDNECWMKTNMVLYLVNIPLIIMFIFNLVTYVSVLVASTSSQSIRKKTSARNVRQHVILSVSVFVLLGLTWVFGFGIAGSDYSALLFGYLFAVFNSMQGFFIFGLFIVRNNSTRKEITNQVKEGVAMAQQATKDFMSYTNGATNNSYIDNQGDHAPSKSASVL